jgi:hypothetical protein
MCYPIGNNGGHEETRTPDLYRVNRKINAASAT